MEKDTCRHGGAAERQKASKRAWEMNLKTAAPRTPGRTELDPAGQQGHTGPRAKHSWFEAGVLGGHADQTKMPAEAWRPVSLGLRRFMFWGPRDGYSFIHSTDKCSLANARSLQRSLPKEKGDV